MLDEPDGLSVQVRDPAAPEAVYVTASPCRDQLGALGASTVAVSAFGEDEPSAAAVQTRFAAVYATC